MSPIARRLLLHRDLAELERLAVWIEGWAKRDLSPELSFAVQVCLEEAVANIIMYSATQDDRLEIVVEVGRSDRALVAWIEDNGSTFDPTQVPRPPVPTSLTQAKAGNLGIFHRENLIEDFVRRQTVFIFLVGRQLGGRRTGDDRFGNHFTQRVSVGCQRKH